MNQKYKNHFPFVIYEKMFICKLSIYLINELTKQPFLSLSLYFIYLV